MCERTTHIGGEVSRTRILRVVEGKSVERRFFHVLCCQSCIARRQGFLLHELACSLDGLKICYVHRCVSLARGRRHVFVVYVPAEVLQAAGMAIGVRSCRLTGKTLNKYQSRDDSHGRSGLAVGWNTVMSASLSSFRGGRNKQSCDRKSKRPRTLTTTGSVLSVPTRKP